MESNKVFFSWLPFSTHETWGCWFFKRSPWLINDQWWSYCWWTNSCTTKDDDSPIIYRVLTIPDGAGFCPSTVGCIWDEISLHDAGPNEASEDIFSGEFLERLPSSKLRWQAKNHTFFLNGDTLSFMVGIFHCQVRFVMDTVWKQLPCYESLIIHHPPFFRFFSLKKNPGDYRKLEIGGGVWRLRGLSFLTRTSLPRWLKWKIHHEWVKMFFFLLNMGGVFQLDLHRRFFGEKSAFFFFPQTIPLKTATEKYIVSAFFCCWVPRFLGGAHPMKFADKTRGVCKSKWRWSWKPRREICVPRRGKRRFPAVNSLFGFMQVQYLIWRYCTPKRLF